MSSYFGDLNITASADDLSKSGPGTVLNFSDTPAIVTPLFPDEEKALAPLYEKKSALPFALAAGAALLLFA